jgi:hypothetical protein
MPTASEVSAKTVRPRLRANCRKASRRSLIRAVIAMIGRDGIPCAELTSRACQPLKQASPWQSGAEYLAARAVEGDFPELVADVTSAHAAGVTVLMLSDNWGQKPKDGDPLTRRAGKCKARTPALCLPDRRGTAMR